MVGLTSDTSSVSRAEAHSVDPNQTAPTGSTLCASVNKYFDKFWGKLF